MFRINKVVKKIVVSLFLVSIGLTLASCGMLKMKDSSSDTKYSWIIGKKIDVIKNVWAIGITNHRNYKKPADHISLYTGGGISGPEVVFSEKCCKGAQFKIVKVMTPPLRFFAPIKYIFEAEILEKYELPSGTNVWLPIKDGNLGLNPRYFKVVK